MIHSTVRKRDEKGRDVDLEFKFGIHDSLCNPRLSHRKGAYDEASDYIMNTIACLILNRPYNVSQVIFEYMKENINAGDERYIM
ncbi:hypothetical protein Hanom_Chr14g01252961 [Helianthus anomalus]